MKYNITLNQPAMIEYNLNVPKFAILDILSVAPTWCESIIVDKEVYFWVARQKICEELKAFDYKPDTMFKYLKELRDLGFIEYIKQGKKDLVRLTNKGKSIFITMSEKNPNYYVGKKSEFTMSEKNPTYNNTSNNNTNINIKSDFNEIWKSYTLDFIRVKIRPNGGGSKYKALTNFKKLISKYSLKEIKALVEYETKKKIGHRDLERVLKLEDMKQFIEDNGLIQSAPKFQLEPNKYYKGNSTPKGTMPDGYMFEEVMADNGNIIGWKIVERR